MGNRRIDNLDLPGSGDESAAGRSEAEGGLGGGERMQEAVSAASSELPTDAAALPPTDMAANLLVDVNYPTPTLVSVVLRDVASWSGMNFVLEPRANVRIQIIAPRKQPPHIAYGLVMAALAVVHLRAVHDGGAVKIVSEWVGASA